MINKKLVSILVVSYNAEKYIKKTIDSCLNQTYDNLELLVLDNASDDNTVRIVRQIAKKDNRLKVFESKKNLGPYGGLNFLLERAQGKYIAIQDHDDIWFPDKIRQQVDFLDKNHDFITCGANTWYFFEKEDFFILNKKPGRTNFVDHTSLVFRNDNFRYKENIVLADEYFEKQTLNKGSGIYCIQSDLVVHRIKRDGTNLSNSRFSFRYIFLKEFFLINGVNIESLIYLSSMLLSRYIPSNILWFLRFNILWKNKKRLTLSEFKKQNPDVDV